MAPVIHIDVPWLLQRHEEVLPDQPTVNDFSALVAAVARHRVDPPRLGAARMLELMAMDKKVKGGRVRLVLPDGIGRASVTTDYAREALEALLAERVGE